jgi:hypothetical protein
MQELESKVGDYCMECENEICNKCGDCELASFIA